MASFDLLLFGSLFVVGLSGEEHGESCGSEDDGLGLEDEEEATPEGQQQAVQVVDTGVSEPLGLGYGAARRLALESIKEIASSTYEVVRASREHIQDHTQRLDVLPPTLVVDIDRDVIELYTRLGVARDKIFSQRYRFRSLEQERTAVTVGDL
nr:hypothetical protein [Tanacetum cinerariifolium]